MINFCPLSFPSPTPPTLQIYRKLRNRRLFRIKGIFEQKTEKSHKIRILFSKNWKKNSNISLLQKYKNEIEDGLLFQRLRYVVSAFIHPTLFGLLPSKINMTIILFTCPLKCGNDLKYLLDGTWSSRSGHHWVEMSSSFFSIFF